ncbi:transcription factor e(y)2-domain-containing protein [Globomyces pollinis-pini]|nr:transcription factor e(y)2-domain-containing protein [Globomyces pollinis-pini]
MQPEFRPIIENKLIKTGEKDRLREYLRQRLIECGWKEELKIYCREVIQTKGLDHVTIDDLVKEITPKGKAMVPEAVKNEMMTKIRKYLTDD